MKRQTLTPAGSSYRTAGWAAISSGVMGILAIGSLIGYLVLRNPSPDEGTLMSRFHDAGAIFQFLLMIPVAFGLHKLSQQSSPGMNNATLATGIAAICFTALSLLLIFPRIVSEILYMVPQGVFGVWLIIISRRLEGLFPRGLRWFGIIVGFGLMLVGTFPLGFAIFVDTAALQIPVGPPKDFPVNLANKILHQVLWIGSLMGVFMLPFWTILTGRRLLGEIYHTKQFG